MIGEVGTIFGRHGINIDNAAVGYEPDSEGPEDDSDAVMVLTTTTRVPEEVIAEIVAMETVHEGRSVSLGLPS